MLISVAIPFHKGNDTLPGVFNALARLQLLPNDRLEVVIAVDGEDELPDQRAWQNFSWPVHLYQQEQRGQSAATNLAARQATGDFLWLLAQDMEPRPDALLELQKVAAQWPNALVQGHIEHKPELLEGRFTHFIANESNFQFAFHAFAEPEDLRAGQHYSPNALLERNKFLTLGGYDEQLPYGFQDADFGLRWRLNGDRIVYAPNAVAIHNHDLTFDGYSNRQYQIGRAAVDFFVKWNQIDYLGVYPATILNFEATKSADIQSAQELYDRWRKTGEVGSLPEGYQGSGAGENDFQRALYLLLGWAYLKGIRDRLAEQGLANIAAPEILRNSDGSWPHPYSWIDRMAVERARPRPEGR